MNKIYHILCVFLVVALLIVGCISLVDRDATHSELEDRDLMTFPKITISGLFDGSFTRELQAYYGETFPGREGLLEGDFIVDIFFHFNLETEETAE